MQTGLTNTIDPNILEILISSETKTINSPSRIRLSTSLNDYAIRDSHIGKSFSDIYILCHRSLINAEPRILEICLNTYDVGPWLSLLFENDMTNFVVTNFVMTNYKRKTFAERFFLSLLIQTKYLSTGYRVSGEKYTPQGQLSGHIIAFPTIKDALEEHFPVSISQLESII
jgi:hypothetical protein